MIENYTGGDVYLPGDPDKVIRVTECPDLEAAVGCTLITSDGTTLLGADDKAGIAVIMEAAAFLMENPDRPHGPIRICFTCDEEIGRGVDHIDLEQLGAVACYTLDGSGADTIDIETFSADLAVVNVVGKNIHPSIAKDKMVNAVRAAGDFLARLPHDRLAPEVTEGREGFMHPYEISGGVASVRMKILLRDFDTSALADHAEVLRVAAEETKRVFPGVEIRNRRQVSVPQHGRRAGEGPPGCRLRQAGSGETGSHSGIGDRSWRDGRFPSDRDGAADAQSVVRSAHPPLPPGMGMPGGNGPTLPSGLWRLRRPGREAGE